MAVANVDGALVGGASLKAEDFLGIAARLPLSRRRMIGPVCGRGGSMPGDRVETAPIPI